MSKRAMIEYFIMFLPCSNHAGFAPEISIIMPPATIINPAKGRDMAKTAKSKTLLSMTKKSVSSHEQLGNCPHGTSEVSYPGHIEACAIPENKNKNVNDNKMIGKSFFISVKFLMPSLIKN